VRLRLADQEFNARLSHIARPCFRKKKKTKPKIPRKYSKSMWGAFKQIHRTGLITFLHLTVVFQLKY
jgi:hypothetical protein